MSARASLPGILTFLKPQAAPGDSDENAILREQQRQLAGMSLIAAGVSLFNGGALFLIVRSGALVSVLPWVWYGFIAVSAGFLAREWFRHGSGLVPAQVSGRYLRRAEWMALLIGAVWGSAVWMVDASQQLPAFFVTLVQIGMASGFAALTAPLPRVSIRFVVPCVGTTGAWYLVNGEAIGLTATLLTLVLSLALLLGGFNSRRQLAQLVRSSAAARTARQDLSDAVEALSDAFTIYDSHGRLVMANRRFSEWFPQGLGVDEDGDGSIRQIGQGRWVKRSVVPVSDGRRVSIHTDVTDLKNRERELIAARREAEEANAAKGRFLSTMSQELRTPLDIINGFSRLMKGDSQLRLSPEEIADYAGSIHAAGEHLLTVVNDIIEFSKVGAERYLHDPVEVDLRDLLANAVSLSAGFQRLTSLEGIDVSVSSRIGSIVVDEMAFRRVLMNLVTNAIQHGGEPVNISIRAFLRADGAPVVTIRDFGRGLPGSELERVFEPFYQSQPQRAGEFSGTGLGLTLSRELARLHGGDVHLSSREGAGTTASIVLPASAHIPPELAEPAPVSGDALGQGEAA